jgi:hypothetical protein
MQQSVLELRQAMLVDASSGGFGGHDRFHGSYWDVSDLRYVMRSRKSLSVIRE